MHAVYARVCNFQDQCLPFVDTLARQIRIGQVIICLEKDQAGRQRRTLVAIVEWMIAAEIKKIGSRHFEHILDQRFPAMGSLRRCDCGLEQWPIAQSGHTTVRSQHFPVDRLHRLDSKKPKSLLRQGA